MKRISALFSCLRRRNIVRDQRGVAAVEFALISTGMFAMLSGAVDLTQAITIHRDLNRLAAEVAQAVTACPDLACRKDIFNSLNDRRANIAPQFAAMVASGAYFGETSGRITNMEGTMTELPAAPVNLRAQALAMLQEGDKGVAVQITFTHRPIILGFADNWGFTTRNFTASTVTLARRP